MSDSTQPTFATATKDAVSSGAERPTELSSSPAEEDAGIVLPTFETAFEMVLVLYLLTAAVFIWAFDFGFVAGGDYDYVLDNPHVNVGFIDFRYQPTPAKLEQNPSAYLEFLQKQLDRSLVYAWTTTDTGAWHPITWMSLMLDAQLAQREGMISATPFHVTNMILHGFTVVFLFLALRWMTGRHWESSVVAAIYAVHPLHVQSVCWIAERKGILALFFGMAALLVYAWYGKTPRSWKMALVAFLFALSLMSKPTFLMFPLLLLLLDFWPLGRHEILARQLAEEAEREVASPPPVKAEAVEDEAGEQEGEEVSGPASPWQTLVLEKVPLFILAFAGAVIAYYAQQTGRGLELIDEVDPAGRTVLLLDLPARIANGVSHVLIYVGQMFWPDSLAAVYSVSPQTLPNGTFAIAAGLLIAALCFAAFTLREHFPEVYTGWYWYLLALIPVLGIHPITSALRADRYTDLPMIGILIALVFGISRLVPKSLEVRPWLLGGLAIAVIGGLAYRSSAVEVPAWRDSITLYKTAVDRTNANYLAYDLLGQSYFREERTDDAIASYRKAIEILEAELEPLRQQVGDDPLPRVRAAWPILVHLGQALRIKGDLQGAQNQFASLQLLFQRATSRLAELASIPGSGVMHANAEMRLASQAASDFGLVELRKASFLSKPEDREAAVKRALEKLQLAQQFDPKNLDAQVAMAEFLIQVGEIDRAREQLGQVFKVDPNHAQAHLVTGRLEFGLKNYREAMGRFLLRIAKIPNHPKQLMDHYMAAEALVARDEPDDIHLAKVILIQASQLPSEGETDQQRIVRMAILDRLAELYLRNFPDKKIYGNPVEAMRYALEAAELAPDDHPHKPTILFRLALSQGEQGHFKDSKEMALTALALADQQVQKGIIKQIDEGLKQRLEILIQVVEKKIKEQEEGVKTEGEKAAPPSETLDSAAPPVEDPPASDAQPTVPTDQVQEPAEEQSDREESAKEEPTEEEPAKEEPAEAERIEAERTDEEPASQPPAEDQPVDDGASPDQDSSKEESDDSEVGDSEDTTKHPNENEDQGNAGETNPDEGAALLLLDDPMGSPRRDLLGSFHDDPPCPQIRTGPPNREFIVGQVLTGVTLSAG